MIKSTLVVAAAAAALVCAPLAQAADPAAERAFLDEFHQAVGIVPINTWNDKLSLNLGYTICRAARDGINLQHYYDSPWQGKAVVPALRHLCPELAAEHGVQPPAPPPLPPPLPAEQG